MMHAQYLTTWVASYGNDGSNCLREFPCRTFAAAYIKTDSQGTIRAIDAGVEVSELCPQASPENGLRYRFLVPINLGLL